MVVTKAQFAGRLHEQIGLNKREAKDMVDLFFETIKETLAQGQHVKISGLGKFMLRDKVGRSGRNPKTGEDTPISARRVVTFRVSEMVRAQINELAVEQLQTQDLSPPAFDEIQKSSGVFYG